MLLRIYILIYTGVYIYDIRGTFRWANFSRVKCLIRVLYTWVLVLLFGFREANWKGTVKRRIQQVDGLQQLPSRLRIQIRMRIRMWTHLRIRMRILMIPAAQRANQQHSNAFARLILILILILIWIEIRTIFILRRML